MAASRYSASPECSDENEASSAPSEFLAEFLSAIMRRQYAEALKYCQLILQYEPNNSTARGFYPLLQHKLTALHTRVADETSSSEETGSRCGRSLDARLRRVTMKNKKEAEMEAEVEAEVEAEEMDQGSGSACSSLELDSSASGVARSSDSSEPSDSTSWRWESSGERSERDDNGNPPPTTSGNSRLIYRVTEGADAANDNAPGGPEGRAAGGPEARAAGGAAVRSRARSVK